jgi:hypothetical protein
VKQTEDQALGSPTTLLKVGEKRGRGPQSPSEMLDHLTGLYC